jgi:hypothetical protein
MNQLSRTHVKLQDNWKNVIGDQMLENYLTENAENAPSVKISKMDKLHK